MVVLWLVVAVVCVAAGLALLWFDRRRRRPADPAPVDQTPDDGRTDDLFRESNPR